MEDTDIDVRALRHRLGLSQADLAHRLGVSTRSITNWEAGRTSVHPRTRAALATLAAAPDTADARTAPSAKGEVAELRREVEELRQRVADLEATARVLARTP